MTELAIGLGVAGFITSLFGILVAVLIRQLRYMRFRLRVSSDAWDRIQRSYEREIDVLEQLGDMERVNQLRRDYAEQQAAWRAQQGVVTLAPREVPLEGRSSLTDEEVEQLRGLLAASRRLDPGALSAEDHFLRGNSYYDTRQYEEALADYNRSLELRHDAPNTLNNRGNTLQNLGRYEEALADYNRSLEMEPDDPTTLTNRGVTLRNLGRYEEALADYNRSLELEPDDTTTLTNRGVMLTHLGRYEEALADFSRSLELRPDDPVTLYNVACLYSVTGRYEEALQSLEKAIAGDAKYRRMAAEDEDFAPLRGHPQYGPQVQELIAGDLDA